MDLGRSAKYNESILPCLVAYDSRNIEKLEGFLCINIGDANFKSNLFHNYWGVWGEILQNTSKNSKFERFSPFLAKEPSPLFRKIGKFQEMAVSLTITLIDLNLL
ncbi:hypothetical protein T4B_7710 [Trichinella pseudospiralis]|uniref:Uncharacterized protein n=2 Tax=Trichinella pseudospiralis TaxID=6337 RepID=A0A0V1II49_TRIPS|nr:hypothetical protein T4A_10077 [Trichinella pseudospiralis]KRY85205.1 hypothetical protein T4D_14901 [Trichinella pseudospiralis]KRZ22429.1 hypothetical protein T4B_7710 [Trichinella pseudospiralis]KRZ36581.1 hypothetical protein T4C_1687 [Trichinella pseudospiralis]